MMKVQQKTGVYLFTVSNLEGWEIEEYYGLVTGHAIYGANFVKDFFARVSDTVGGRVGGYEASMEGAMTQAMTQMAEKASKLGANAVLAIDLEASSMGPKMLMATSCGTAVRIKPKKGESAQH